MTRSVLNRLPTPPSQNDICALSWPAVQAPGETNSARGEEKLTTDRRLAHGTTIDGRPTECGPTWNSPNVMRRPDASICQPVKFDALAVVPESITLAEPLLP